MPHEVPLQVALPFVGTAHGSQRLPHVAVLASDAQLSPQRWYASTHEKSQLMPIAVLVHAGTELSGPAGHGAHDEPQVLTSKSDTQLPVHSWKLRLQLTPQLVPSHEG